MFMVVYTRLDTTIECIVTYALHAVRDGDKCKALTT